MSDRHSQSERPALLGSLSPTAHAASEARFSRDCLTRHLPPSGFRNLMAASIFRRLPALFQTGSAHGVYLQGLSPTSSLRNLSISVPSWSSCLPAGRLSRRLWQTLTSKALLPKWIRHLMRRFPSTLGRCPPGLSLSREFPPATAWRKARSPRVLRAYRLLRRSIFAFGRHYTSGSMLRLDWLVSRETAAPSELSHLIRIPRVRLSVVPSLLFRHGWQVLLPILADRFGTSG